MLVLGTLIQAQYKGGLELGFGEVTEMAVENHQIRKNDIGRTLEFRFGIQEEKKA